MLTRNDFKVCQFQDGYDRNIFRVKRRFYKFFWIYLKEYEFRPYDTRLVPKEFESLSLAEAAIADNISEENAKIKTELRRKVGCF